MWEQVRALYPELDVRSVKKDSLSEVDKKRIKLNTVPRFVIVSKGRNYAFGDSNTRLEDIKSRIHKLS